MKHSTIVIVVGILAPYRIPFYNELVAQSDSRIVVISLADSEPNRDWHVTNANIEFEWVRLSGYSGYSWKFEAPFHLRLSITRVVSKFKPSVLVLPGWDQPSYWQLLLWAKLRRKTLILQIESHAGSSKVNNKVAIRIRKFFVRRANRVVAFGSATTEFLAGAGVPSNRIFSTINAVAPPSNERQTRSSNPGSVQSISTENATQLKILFVGQLITRKNATMLLSAAASLEPGSYSIQIAGTGAERENLEQRAEKLEIDNIEFLGNVNTIDLRAIYESNDVLVIPSFTEVWGLVVNEALMAGLTVLSSNTVGAAKDLISNGFNGDTFSPSDPTELANLLHRCQSNIQHIRDSKSKISEDANNRFSVQTAVRVFAEATKIDDVAHTGPTDER